MTEPDSCIQIKLVGKKEGAPPKVQLLFDVALHNASEKPRWFLLPVWITDPIKNSGAGIDGVEVYRLHGKGTAFSTWFQGTADFHAILLNANTHLILRSFPIRFWSEDDMPSFASVAIAESIYINGKPAQEWIGLGLISENDSDVSADNREIILSRHTENRSEVPIKINLESMQKIDLCITRDER